MKKNLIFIGPMRLGEVPRGGDTMKNQLFLKRFTLLFDRVYAVDTIDWKQHPLVLLKMILYLLFIRNASVVVSCEASSAKIIDFLYYVRLQKNVFYWVVGSGFPRRIKNGKLSPRHFGFLKKIIVQSPEMVQDLEQAGLGNAVYMPNSKPMYNIPLTEHNKSVIKFVFLSRILPEKGIDLIFSCVKSLNEAGYHNKFSVDFYGFRPDEYDAFYENVKLYDNVGYRGLLDLTGEEGYWELSSYDVMLFPTFYEGEGFPGVVIDSYIAGVPIVASDWHCNKSLIRERETGFVIPAKDKQALLKAMKYILDNSDILCAMRTLCQQEAHKYDIANIISRKSLTALGLFI